MTFVPPPPAPPKPKKKITLTAANKVEIPSALMKASEQFKKAPDEEKRIGYDNDQMMTKADFQRRYKNDPKGWEWYWAAGIGEQPPEYKRKAPNGKFYAQKDFQKYLEKELEDLLKADEIDPDAVSRANANKRNWLQLWEQAEKAQHPIPASKCPPGCISLRKANQLIAERKIIDPDLYADPVADKAAELEARLLANGGKLVGNYKSFEDDLDNAEDLREAEEGDDWLEDDLYADINAPTPPGQGSSSGAPATPKSGPSTIGGPGSSVGTPATPKGSSKAGSPPKMQSKTPHRPVLASPVKPKTPPQPFPMAALTLDPPNDQNQYDYGTWVGKTNALVQNAVPRPVPSPAMLTPAVATPSAIPGPFAPTPARPSPGPPSAAMALMQLGKASSPRPAQSAKKQSPPRPAQPKPSAGPSLWMQTLNTAKQQNLASFEYLAKDGTRTTYVRAPVDPKRPNFVTYVRADGKKPSKSACAGLSQANCSGDCKWAANAKTPHCRTGPKKKSPSKKKTSKSPSKKKTSTSPSKKKASTSPSKKNASPVKLVTPPAPPKNKNAFFVDLDDDM